MPGFVRPEDFFCGALLIVVIGVLWFFRSSVGRFLSGQGRRRA